MPWVRVAASLILTVIPLCIGNPTLANDESTATVVVFNCPANGNEKPRLVIDEAHSRDASFQDINDTPKSLASGVWEFKVQVTSGQYYFKAVGGHYCNATAPMTVLRGHSRHIILSMNPSLLVADKTDALAGSLPFDGVGVSLLNTGSGRLLEGIVDDRAFYFDLLPDGAYTLRILFQDRNYVEIPVNIKGFLTIRNLTISDFQGYKAFHNFDRAPVPTASHSPEATFLDDGHR